MSLAVVVQCASFVFIDFFIHPNATMTLPVLYGDEAGNTGPALLDPEQPIFTYAMTDLLPDEAADALALLKLNSAEVHSTSLFRRPGGIERLARFFEHPAVRPDRVSVFVIHKKHMVVSKMIDLLVENLAYEAGVDLYKDGGNIAMANLATMMIESFLDAGQQGRLLGSFVQMLKLPSSDSVEEFYRAVDQTMEELPVRKRLLFEDFMVPIAASRRIIFEVLPNNDKFTLDPIVPSVFSLAYHWGKKYRDGFVLKADESKTLALKRDEMAMFMADHLEGITIGYDSRRHPARLPVRELIFCRSEKEPSIQVADIVAGVVTRYGAPFAGLVSGKERSNQLSKFDPDAFMAGNVWPTLDVTPDKIGKKHEGGVHPVDAYPRLLRPKP
jgi:hypothetical protein